MSISITIIYGTSAVGGYYNNQPGYANEGREMTYNFETQGEVDAFQLGLEEMDGWMAFCVKTEEITTDED